jgi:hypothetical protein
MPTYRVVLYDKAQGRLDSFANQRTVWATGPDGVNRLFKHGDTFVGPDYWNTFTKPKPGSFLEVVGGETHKKIKVLSKDEEIGISVFLDLSVKVNGTKLY